MKIGIANDHAGFDLKKSLIDHLKGSSYEIIDLGSHTQDSVDYPDFANLLCEAILKSDFNQGILICGTGIGMSIAANRHKGIRAAVCNEGPRSAELARKHNNANILCLGARIIDEQLACKTLDMFLRTEFEGERHLRRLEKIDPS
jgi:ribose 5-phosphate isomerase B